MQIGKAGPTVRDSTAQRAIRRALNAHSAQLAEKTLAKALEGDTTALLACAILMLVSHHRPEQQK